MTAMPMGVVQVSDELLVVLLDNTVKVLYHILPALITIGFGSYLVQRFFVSRSNQAGLIDLLVRQLDSVREDSLEYWNLHLANNGDKQRQVILAQKLKGAIKNVSSDLHFFCEKYCQPEKKRRELVGLLAEIADACTGGSFESAKKPVDKDRYLLIVNAINHLRSALFRQKL